MYEDASSRECCSWTRHGIDSRPERLVPGCHQRRGQRIEGGRRTEADGSGEEEVEDRVICLK